MRERLRSVMRAWLPIAVAVSLGCLGISLIGQHIMRTTGDDPQVQLAQDGATSLDRGAMPDSIVPSATVDPAISLAPFIMVYNASGEVLAGSASLGTKPPVPPSGVLATAVQVGGNRVTWEPADGVRIAAVVYPTKDGRTVLAGRSLKEIDGRIRSAEQIVGLGWLFTLTVTFVSAWFAYVIDPPERR